MPAAPAESPAAPAAETASGCFHCGLPLPRNADFSVIIDGVRRPMCCRGCEAVARAIVDGGLGDYYRYRTQPAPTGRERVPAFLQQTAVYDHPGVQKSFVRVESEHVREAALILEGIACAACIWLNERYLSRLPEIHSSNGNRRQGAERAAINAPMQGTAEDIVKLAMIAVRDWLAREKLRSKLIMQVHDELVLEVPDDEIDTVKNELPRLMGGVAKLDIPLLVETGVGPNWEKAH